MCSVQPLEPALCPAFADDPPRLHRFGKALKLERTEPNQLKQIADQAARAVGDNDGVGFSSLLQTGGEIGCLPGYCFLFRGTLAEQIAHPYKAGGDANTNCQLVSCAGRYAADGRGYRECRPNGSLRCVFACPRPAEIGQHAISQEL